MRTGELRLCAPVQEEEESATQRYQRAKRRSAVRSQGEAFSTGGAARTARPRLTSVTHERFPGYVGPSGRSRLRRQAAAQEDQDARRLHARGRDGRTGRAGPLATSASSAVPGDRESVTPAPTRRRSGSSARARPIATAASCRSARRSASSASTRSATPLPRSTSAKAPTSSS
jgi:hypothetical protein